ncbi:hypothetical protein [Algoriphagus halophilus]|uniref:Outer membrane protein beta-barrel domain-containing protein n=1 Tax=Algoriphagus halophilus TaxID=226505 RepID=A0A1N6DRB1_9BACT|nr:hypothetical protein [Algoriphagus halophilus]SIN73321.1 hypothetical protein SAMN05444394_1296 [Algoriphagus halophilus]
MTKGTAPVYFFFLMIWVLFTCFDGMAQTDSTDRNYTPYELLTSYYEQDFKPFKKRNIYTGLRFNLTDKYEENTDYLIQNIIDGDRLDYNIVLKGGYYISDYAMVGLSVNYFQNKFIGNIYREPDTVASNSITRGYSFTPNFRSTVPLTKNERLSFFTEMGVTFGNSTTLTRRTSNVDVVSKEYSKDFNFRVGISPGVTFFVMEAFAFEVQLDVLGYELNVTKGKDGASNQESKRIKQSVDFNINLLSLNIGLAYYIGAKRFSQ